MTLGTTLTSDFAPEEDSSLVDISFQLAACEVDAGSLLKVDSDSIDLDILHVARHTARFHFYFLFLRLNY